MRNFSILFLTSIFLTACAGPVTTGQPTATLIPSTATTSPTATPVPTHTPAPATETAPAVEMDRVMDDIKIIPESEQRLGVEHGMNITIATDESRDEYPVLKENWGGGEYRLTPSEALRRHIEEIGWLRVWKARGGG